MGKYFTLIFLLISKLSFSQDIIETKSGERILAKVIDSGVDEIKYKLHDNIMGPMQSIPKDSLLQITFSNGAVKRFIVLPEPIDMMNEPEKYKVSNRNPAVLWEYQFDPSIVFDGDTIRYFGLDMSSFKYINTLYANEETLINHYLLSWHQYFNEFMTLDLMRRGLKTTRVKLDTSLTNHSHEQIYKDWVRNEWKGLSINDVITSVGKFHQTIQGIKGVGYIIILDNYNKDTDKTTAIFTFFEIDSGAILWAAKVEGNAGDKHPVKHWGIGMSRMYHNFRLAIYEKGYKQYLKEKYSD